jgi:hypothetical protein
MQPLCARESGLLDQLDVIECFGRPGRDLRMAEITAKQQESRQPR